MQQAAIIIAVSQTASNQLQRLQAAIRGARAMEQWAQGQGFEYIVVLTDENGPLRIYEIKDAIETLVNKGTVEQLVVYFSGHGVNNRSSEYWLLSKAPNDTQEAVNVTGSVDLARRSGIPHVVFISDACRTPADGIQAQNVTGSEIFPNNSPAGQEKFVDQFFACVLGDPALEVKGADNQYRALYTQALVEGLSCNVNECIENTQIGGKIVALVRPWPLRWYLDGAVPRLLLAAAISPTYSQIPDARLCSPPATWLARKDLGAGTAPVIPAQPQGPTPPQMPPPDTVSPLMARRLSGAEARSRGFINALEEKTLAPKDRTRGLPQETSSKIMAEAEARAMSFGRAHFETRCGFKVQGAQLAQSFHPNIATGLDGPDSARVDTPHPASIVLRFEDGGGVILPAIPEFVAGLTFENGNLLNVVYEPSDTSPRWHEYQGEIDRLRKLRGRIAAATRYGIFQPTGEGIGELARQMQVSKGFDPTMALYAGYAYHSIQQTERIAQMEEYLFLDLGLRFFDLALLGGTFHLRPDRNILPMTPLLS